MDNIIFKSSLGAGLFAQIKKILETIYLNQNGKKNIIIDFSQEYFPYKDNNNNICEFHNILTIKKNISYDEDLIIYDKNNKNVLFHNLFNYDQDLVKSTKNRQPIIEFRSLNNIKKTNYLKKLNRIFNDSIEINKKILENVEYFYQKYKEYYILGIHYRAAGPHNCELVGTHETNFHLKINNIFKKIDNIQKEKNIDINKFKIYLATDVKSIQDDFIKKYGENLIYNDNNKYMMKNANDPIEPHFGFSLDINTIKDKNFMDLFHKNKPGLDGGIQLMFDCLMLSKCNFLIPSMSNLSDFILILNPEIEYSYFNL